MLKFFIITYLFVLPMFAESQTADFTFQNSNGIFCNPATIRFTQKCTGNPIGFVWDFGNSTKGYSGDLSATYTSAGIFTVTLTAIYNQKTLEVSKTIVINPAVTTSIGFDRNYICTPGAIKFNAISNGNISNFAWDFGDNSGTLNMVKNDTMHSFANFGNYSVSLKATDITGCVGLANATIKIIKPTIAATITPTSGCLPANVNFNANVNVPVSDFVSNYNWDFGDGSPVSSTATNKITHLYGVAGSYSPTLSIVTNDGCTNTYNFSLVAFGTAPFNHIAYPKKSVVCGSETSMLVSIATNANRYFWNFGDGVTASVTDTITKHKYATLGFKTVTVTPYFNGCPGTTISFKIEVVGVISKYTYSNTCNNKKNYSFLNTSQGNISTALWNFGDNSATIPTINAIHNFPVRGQFYTILMVTDSVTGCSDSYLQPVYTADPVLVNSDSSICKNSNTSFSIVNNYTSGKAIYTWNILGLKIGPITDSTINVKAGSLGIFNNFVSINYGSQSCPDTVQLNHPILVKGPNLNFNSPTALCFNTLFNATNTSKPFIAADSISLWYWNYGNTTVNDTIYQPLSFQYKNPGSYNVKLTGIDINGCKDSLTKITTINPNPFLRVVPRLDTMCLGQPTDLRAFSSNNILWSPSNNISCNSCDSAFANPDETTIYFVTATTPLNCSVKDSIFVKVITPFTALAPSNIFYICRNDQIQLDMEPKLNRITWTPSIGLSNTSIYNPVASPQQNTTYIATLTDSVGCFSSNAAINIFVKSSPTVDAGPDKILPYNATHIITPAYSNNVSQYSWVNSNLLNCNNCPAPVGTALYSETFTIKVTSDSGCVATDKVTLFVECKNANILMPKAFTPNNDNLNDTYYPISRGIESILKFAIYNRQGQMMYEYQNFPPNQKAFGWKGEYKGQHQPAATYIYIIEALCEVGVKITKKGSFLLIR